MLQIYGVELSFPTNKVRFTANALGLEYSFKRVNLAAGEQKQPDFLKLNPIGKVPVLKDDQLCLFESNAICRYLARKEKSPLFPEELSKQAIVDQWMEIASMRLASPSLEPGRERDKRQPGKSQRLGLELKIRINRSCHPREGINISKTPNTEG